jgi:hypothetical protein
MRASLRRCDQIVVCVDANAVTLDGVGPARRCWLVLREEVDAGFVGARSFPAFMQLRPPPPKQSKATSQEPLGEGGHASAG